MQQLIDELWIKRLIIVAIIMAVVKILMLLPLYWLPHHGINSFPFQEESFYFKYRPAKAFSLNQTKKIVKKVEPIYKLDNLNLKAIYDDPNGAFIAVEENKKLVLISIDEDFKGYKLIEVHADRAIFKKSSKRYELKFKEDKKNKSAISVAEPEIIADDSAVFIKRKEIKHYAKNFDAIWKNIKIKEIIENRHLKGFEVTWVKKRSMFEKLGLIKGDIIIGVNGKTLKSVSQVFKLYNNIDKLDSLRLKIMRNNEEKELEYEIF
jgi:general secretion pathway protein C